MPATTLPLVKPRARQGGYLSKMCHELIAKDNMPTTYPPELKEEPGLFLQGLFDGGNDFETHIGEVLTEKVPEGELAMIPEVRGPDGERTTEGKREKEAATFAAYLDPKVRIIFNARIGSHFESLLSEYLGHEVRDDARISEPDAIELGDVLDNGLRAMRFIDVKWHKITSGTSVNPKTFSFSQLDQPYFDSIVGPIDFYGAVHNEDWRQLAHYYRHAQTLGLVKPEKSGGAWGAVIGKEEIAVWADLDTITFQMTINGKRTTATALAIYDADFAAANKVVDNARVRDTDPSVEALSEPERKTDCAQCPWNKVCTRELEAVGTGGHITLLPGVTVARAKPLYALGIKDASTLASQDVFGSVPEEFIYQARVTLDGRPHLALGGDVLELPRGDVEVDFDCESDSTVYMWGVRVTDTLTGTVTEHMFDDYTMSDEGEKKVFTDVWAHFQSLMVTAEAADRSVRFYHYSAYERTQMVALAKKYAGQPGVPDVDDVEAFYDQSGAVIDLYQILRKQIVWPTVSHSIKKLAVFAGFSWRDETPGGDMSMLWYRNACTDPDLQVRAENKQRLREYNLDDVAAQAHLREYVTTAPLPSVTTLDAPAAEVGSLHDVQAVSA